MAGLNLNQLAPVPPGLGVLFARQSDVFGAYFVALHSDVEFPVTACTWFVAGVRAEWNYLWTNVLAGQQRDLQDVNLLMNFGWRY